MKKGKRRKKGRRVTTVEERERERERKDRNLSVTSVKFSVSSTWLHGPLGAIQKVKDAFSHEKNQTAKIRRDGRSQKRKKENTRRAADSLFVLFFFNSFTLSA